MVYNSIACDSLKPCFINWNDCHGDDDDEFKFVRIVLYSVVSLIPDGMESIGLVMMMVMRMIMIMLMVSMIMLMMMVLMTPSS